MTRIPARIEKAAEAIYARLGRGAAADVQTIAKALMDGDERARRVARNAIFAMSEADRMNGDLCDDALTTAIRSPQS